MFRVNQRQRENESTGLSQKYVEELVERYGNWFDKLKNPKLNIDTRVYDFIKDQSNSDYVLSMIIEALDDSSLDVQQSSLNA